MLRGKFVLVACAVAAVGAFLTDVGAEWRGTIFVFRGAESLAAPEPAEDYDSDGIPDAWETEHGLDASDASDALLDFDGDGLSALDEFYKNTDPWDIDSVGDAVTDAGAEIPSGYTEVTDSENLTRTIVFSVF